MADMEDERDAEVTRVLGMDDEAPRVAPNPEPLLLIKAPKPEEMLDPETGIVIDALPYIDLQYNEEDLSAQVDALVTEEMIASDKSPDDFLDALKLADYECKFEGSAFLMHEWKRIRNGMAQAPLDQARYRVPPPPEGERDSLEAWQKAVDNAHAQLEHTALRLVNLELLSKFGANAWKTHTENLEAMEMCQTEALAEMRQEVENLNRKRKGAQVAAGDKMSVFEKKFRGLVAKTTTMEVECSALEREVRRLRKKATKRGLIVDGSAAGSAKGTKRFLPGAVSSSAKPAA